MTKEEALRAFRTYKIWDLMDTFTTDELQEMIDAIMPQREKPKVDLEEEITRWFEKGDITDTRFNDYDDSDIERTARHFYELGLNARKGDIVI